MAFLGLNIWEWPDRKKEEAVAEAGGVSVPASAIREVEVIITDSFKDMQENLKLKGVQLDELFLRELQQLEYRLKKRMSTVLRDLTRRTKKYGVLTRDDVYQVIIKEYGGAFKNLLNIADGFIPQDDRYTKPILRMLEEKVRFDTIFYVDKWVYRGTL
jgi:hypothetical protein